MAIVRNSIKLSSGGGTEITVVANYSALPDPTTVSGQFYWAETSQGTSWLPGSLGGTYYNSGMYYSNGVTWKFINVPYQATQAEVNTGTNIDKFVTPETFTNANKWSLYQLLTGKDATGGYAGLTLFKINFKNVANTFTSFFTNSNTASRTYTFKDRNGTIADDTDLALKENALNITAVKTTNYSPAINEFVPVDTTSGSIVITLPTAPADGSQVGAKLSVLSGSNTVTINSGGSDVFNVSGGVTTLSLSVLNQVLIFQYKASSAIWYAVDSSISKTYIDSKITDAIADGATTIAPSQNAVFDALALKLDKLASAYTMRVNNTNATANVAEKTYKSPSVQNYAGTPTFPGGTAPTTPIGLTYNFQVVDNWCKVNFTFVYTNTGATITQIIIPMPSDIPNPVVPTGFTGASAVIYLGSGNMIASSITSIGVSASDMYSYIGRNAGDTAFEFGISGTTGSYKVFRMTIEYPTS